MNILLFLPEKEVRGILTFSLELRFQAKILEADTIDAALEALKGTPDMGLIICDGEHDNKKLFELLNESSSPVPCIFCGPPSEANLKAEPANLVGVANKENLIESLYEIIDKLKQAEEKAVQASESDFCRIKTELLIKASPLKADIYIRLSEKKFLRLFRQGDSFDSEDLQKYYVKKSVQYLYLKSDECKEFMEKFKASLVALLKSNETNPRKISEVAEAAHETVQELVTRLGPTEEVQEIVKANVQLATKVARNNPRLSKLLEGLNRDRHKYISSHSLILGHLSCTISAAMGWNSDTTYFKLNMAAFLHDITMNNNELATVQNLKELEERRAEFSEADYQSYKKHPIHAAELAKQFKEVPPDVDTVILQHHEQPDGSGFPRGLTPTRISPLAAIFIVAHDFLIFILKKDTKEWKTAEFVASAQRKYSTGTFKKVLKALEELKQ